MNTVAIFEPIVTAGDVARLGIFEAAKVIVDDEVIQIDFERTGTWPVKAKGRHHGWLGSLSVTCCSSGFATVGR